jgi:hypothetical protein
MSHKKRYMAKVMHGNLHHTPGGLTKKDIKTVKVGGTNHYVSKKKSKLAKNNFAEWNKAVAKAKKQLGYDKHDFVLLKGELLETAREIYYV